jgi:3-methylcrotonyl-CoA carboxylase beta subunit
LADELKANNTLTSKLVTTDAKFAARREANLRLLAEMHVEEAKLRDGGGAKAIDAQHAKKRLTARERLALLLDEGSEWLELGLWAARGMYAEFGGAPGAGAVAGIGRVSGRLCLIIANDATVKAGAFFPMTAKKVLRAQHIALENHIPTLYLVDSSGVFLPLQEDVFPDQDDFGRVFRNNAVMSAKGIPQMTAIMGMCVAGGAYLPVMTDTVLMTEGSGLFLAGPALVQAAIGQKTDAEVLGGAQMHAEISGTVDFKEPNDHLCLARLRSLVGRLGRRSSVRRNADSSASLRNDKKEGLRNDKEEGLRNDKEEGLWNDKKEGLRNDKSAMRDENPEEVFSTIAYDGKVDAPKFAAEDLYGLMDPDPARAATNAYDVRDVIARLVDRSEFDEYKAEFGRTIVCGYARVGGRAVGFVANQKVHQQQTVSMGPQAGEKRTEFGGVIYTEGAQKAARFIMDCNQQLVPLIFLQDVNGFMVGKDAEWSGIIRAGAKMVSAVSTSVVPKITVILGGSFGAGNYAMCGKAYDPRFIFAWPTARYAVMSGASAANTLVEVRVRQLERSGQQLSDADKQAMHDEIRQTYDAQADPRYAAARLWVDAILDPAKTRDVLMLSLEACALNTDVPRWNPGVMQT